MTEAGTSDNREGAEATLKAQTKPAGSGDSYQEQGIMNNNNTSMEDDKSKDYYTKYEEDSQFRSFVKTLLRPSSEANVSKRSRHPNKTEKIRPKSDFKDSIVPEHSPLETRHYTSSSSKEQKSKTSPTKNNDDIQLSKGKYQSMVKERWGEQRRIDSRIEGEKVPETLLSGHSHKNFPEEATNKQNSSHNNRDPQVGSYGSLPA